MENTKIRVAIAHGDTNGVGYEQILKTFDEPAMMELCTPIVYGSSKVAAFHRKTLNMQTQYTVIAQSEEAKENRLNLLNTSEGDVKVDFGQPSPEANEAARVALKRAIQDVQQGMADVLVTAPDCLPDFLAKEQEVLKVYLTGDLRVAMVNSQQTVKDVANAISVQQVVDKALILRTCLQRDLRISNPRIAVMALNQPGEEEQWGEVEQTVIIPAIEELEQKGVQAFGPYVADRFLEAGNLPKFDAVLVMGYDQGMALIDSLATSDCVCLMTGMPFVWTCPKTSVQFDIAGKGIADENPLRQAVYLAVDVVRNRRAYDAPLKNPLPKLYKEKRDDSEKVRFAVPKSKETKQVETEKNE